jgi:hypothetical protein
MMSQARDDLAMTAQRVAGSRDDLASLAQGRAQPFRAVTTARALVAARWLSKADPAPRQPGCDVVVFRPNGGGL